VRFLLDIKDLCIAAINIKTSAGNDEVHEKFV
jgi:hypothetical protein